MTRTSDQVPRFAGFDGLRGVAILLVIVWHTAVRTSFPEPVMGPLRTLIMTSWAGVDLFFALSGFLITSLVLREEATNVAVTGVRRFSIGRFYARRVLRIMPVFYFVFVLNAYVLAQVPLFTSIRALSLETRDSILGLWPYATFWGNYFPAYAPHFVTKPFYDPGEAYTVYWSLCVEEHFYLVWPLFLVIARSFRVRLGISLFVCFGVLGLRAASWLGGWELFHQNYHSVSHYRLDAILWGALAALMFDRWSIPVRIRRAGMVTAAVTVATLIGTRALSVLPPPSFPGVTLGFSALGIAAAFLVLELAAAPRTWLARALEWRPLRRIGQVSYGMYLLHIQIIDLGGWLMLQGESRKPTLPAFFSACVLFAVLTFVVAWITYQIVEKPFLRIKSRYFDSSPPRRHPRRPSSPPPTRGAAAGAGEADDRDPASA